MGIARQFDSEIIIVHAVAPEPRQAVPMDPIPDEMDTEYAEAKRQLRLLDLRPELNAILHFTILERGVTSEVIASVVERENADLLVLGTSGRTGLKKLALGSVAEELLRMVDCPVLTVGPHDSTSPEANFKSILFATDFGASSERAFQYAANIAERNQAKVILLHAIPALPPFGATPATATPRRTPPASDCGRSPPRRPAVRHYGR